MTGSDQRPATSPYLARSVHTCIVPRIVHHPSHLCLPSLSPTTPGSARHAQSTRRISCPILPSPLPPLFPPTHPLRGDGGRPPEFFWRGGPGPWPNCRPPPSHLWLYISQKAISICHSQHRIRQPANSNIRPARHADMNDN